MTLLHHQNQISPLDLLRRQRPTASWFNPAESASTPAHSAKTASAVGLLNLFRAQTNKIRRFMQPHSYSRGSKPERTEFVCSYRLIQTNYRAPTSSHVSLAPAQAPAENQYTHPQRPARSHNATTPYNEGPNYDDTHREVGAHSPHPGTAFRLAEHDQYHSPRHLRTIPKHSPTCRKCRFDSEPLHPLDAHAFLCAGVSARPNASQPATQASDTPNVAPPKTSRHTTPPPQSRCCH